MGDLAIIVTGGKPGGISTTAEASFDYGVSWCVLPDLPHATFRHTQSGPVTCGNGDSEEDLKKSCWSFNSGVWNKSHTLLFPRDSHSVWSSPLGIMLIGGLDDSDSGTVTTEVIDDGGHSMENFTLDLKTAYACTIQMRDKVIVTGGLATKAVRAYNNSGPLQGEDLPDLLRGRLDHGCGYYVNSDNKVVYLVTGGFASLGGNQLLSTTEILISEAETWIRAGELPRMMAQLRGVSLTNKIIMTGGKDLRPTSAYDTVLSFNITTEKWEDIGTMMKGRHSHGVSFVPAENVIEYLCPARN